jgi:hypothetical protein
MTMSTPLPCNLIQERIVAGEALDERDQAHALACPGCARVTAEWLALDSLLAYDLDGGIVVPDGFADRVMAGLEQPVQGQTGFERMLSRRWVQLVLAHVGLVVALANIVRFVLSALVPAASLGGPR